MIQKEFKPDAKLTPDVKAKWLKALKSGKYIQGFVELVQVQDGVTRHCCLGVLGDIMDELTNDCKIGAGKTPYTYLSNIIGQGAMETLWCRNDCGNYEPDYNKRDYSNVIPLIEEHL